ncbi:glycosyltransferase family 2 protein [Geomonas sp. RF6]|uniref:glycosyltransferase family 2 protein n=1 Tax=Geomonas sp. RF6 TaxID=2897342 RepID=UPI001E5B795B|nr:glycosyltransferase family 2 protein [Geomonas sp. RF6]UFS69107.1 glycosyltransferase family 2 protein [Geomonas sp. RF6]
MVFLFWISFAFVFYTYLGYPLCLAVLKKVRPRPVKKVEFFPLVSVVIAACNEEQNIMRRLENLLAQDYPSDRLEIILVSDGSEDRTVEHALRVAGEKVRIVELPSRQGKAEALNAGVPWAIGDIIVFCDARQTFEEDAIRQLVANFWDETVGCVSGELMLHKTTSSGIQVEMGAYWQYEKWIRKAESSCGSVVGATGAIYAIRRSLYRTLPQGTLLDDVMIPMQVVLQGYRTIFDGSAKAHDIVSGQMTQEWVRKVRTLGGNWQLMGLLPSLLCPWKNRCCWRFVSHKMGRLLVPVALLMLAGLGPLIEGSLYLFATSLQVVFYALAAVGAALPATRSSRMVQMSYFFVVMNLAALAGFWRWLRGDSSTLWRPAYLEGGN